MSPMKDPRFLISRGITHLMSRSSFFGSFAIHFDYVEDPSFKTMATDGVHCFYNPDFVLRITRDHLIGVLAHEAYHVMLKHHLRRGDRDPKRWNYACDYAINPLVLHDGFHLPQGHLYERSYVDLSAETIYRKLPEQLPSKDGDGMAGEVIDATNPDGSKMSDAEIAEAEIKVDGMTRQAAIQAQLAGKLPSHLKDLIETATEPQVDWRSRIQTVLRRGAPQDFTYSRPKRSALASLGIYMPSLIGGNAGTLAFGIDSSGSTDNAMQSVFLGEINGVMQQIRPERAILIQCDTRIQHIDDRTDGAPLQSIEIRGRGGTDFNPPFRWLKEKGIVPEAMVYLTDGYGPFPKEPPPFPVYWVMCSNVKAPWGETINVRV